MATRKLKLGIDVGGTFTHAVALDLADFSIAGKTCVPTSHSAVEGVARGVADSLLSLIDLAHIAPDEIVLIAHSTTQATNALLEGDTAQVGILCLGGGLEGRLAARQADLGTMEIAPGKVLRTTLRYLDLATPLTEARIRSAIAELVAEGAAVLVATEAFGVDRPANEALVVATAARLGLMATAASSISKLYGIRTRTRTAVINASMMPKMLETANLTEKAVRDAGIRAPLMVMRSDGGIMDIAEMRRRPILTMLSGPAAGVAAALMYVKVTDGVFLEVGGTSTDISVIKNGKPQVKSAQLGGHHLYLETLDVRTLGIAGGSIPRVRGTEIFDVGPRSAHIAGLAYVSFCDRPAFGELDLEQVRPLEGDPADYLAVRPREDAARAYAVTPTCAANLLGFGGEATGHGAANLPAVASFFESLGRALGASAKEVATRILELSADKLAPVVRRLVREYKLDPEMVEFVGGGGGACAIVPFTAHRMKVRYRLAQNLEVVSAIGAALGLIRDSVERNMVSPTESDILALRQEAYDSVLAMGAIPETVEVTVEIDTQNKKVTAVALGSSELRTRDVGVHELPDAELIERSAASLKTAAAEVRLVGSTSFLRVMACTTVRRRLFGLLRQETRPARVIDREGTIRLQLADASVAQTTAADARARIQQLVETLTAFGDAGALLPDIFLLISGRVVDLSGLHKGSQVLALAEVELAKVPASDEVVVLAAPKS